MHNIETYLVDEIDVYLLLAEWHVKAANRKNMGTIACKQGIAFVAGNDNQKLK